MDDDGVLVSTLADHPTLAGLVRAFVGRLPARLEQLQAAYRSSDFATLKTLAHALRGAGGTYGLAPLSEAAEDLEHRLTDGAGPEEVAAAVARLRDVCRRAMAGAAES